jgi:hypothetical protein
MSVTWLIQRTCMWSASQVCTLPHKCHTIKFAIKSKFQFRAMHVSWDGLSLYIYLQRDGDRGGQTDRQTERQTEVHIYICIYKYYKRSRCKIFRSTSQARMEEAPASIICSERTDHDRQRIKFRHHEILVMFYTRDEFQVVIRLIAQSFDQLRHNVTRKNVTNTPRQRSHCVPESLPQI